MASRTKKYYWSNTCCRQIAMAASKAAHTRRILDGVCTTCSAPRDHIGLVCKKCFERRHELLMLRRSSRNAQGLCAHCGNNPQEKPGNNCRVCMDRNAKWRRDQITKKRDRVYAAYGNRCYCCRVDIPQMLSVDHVNGDGAKHREELFGERKWNPGVRLYDWIIKNNFPDTIRLACYNCNCGAHRNCGVCPHQAIQAREAEDIVWTVA